MVPFYFWLWYNEADLLSTTASVMVPFYFWLWYNLVKRDMSKSQVMVPFYFWLWYNLVKFAHHWDIVMVPFYFWLWYNIRKRIISRLQLIIRFLISLKSSKIRFFFLFLQLLDYIQGYPLRIYHTQGVIVFQRL